MRLWRTSAASSPHVYYWTEDSREGPRPNVVAAIVPVSMAERCVEREPPSFWPLPSVAAPRIASWNGSSWDVVELPSGDCGVHGDVGRYCLKCATTQLWAKQQPKQREARGATTTEHPWRATVRPMPPKVEVFRKAGSR